MRMEAQAFQDGLVNFNPVHGKTEELTIGRGRDREGKKRGCEGMRERAEQEWDSLGGGTTGCALSSTVKHYTL